MAGFGALALVAPEAGEAGGGAELERSRALFAADLDRLSKVHVALIEPSPSHEQPAPDVMQFGLRPALAVRLRRAQRVIDQLEGIGELSYIGFGARQRRLHVRSRDTATSR